MKKTAFSHRTSPRQPLTAPTVIDTLRVWYDFYHEYVWSEIGPLLPKALSQSIILEFFKQETIFRSVESRKMDYGNEVLLFKAKVSGFCNKLYFAGSQQLTGFAGWWYQYHISQVRWVLTYGPISFSCFLWWVGGSGPDSSAWVNWADFHQ